MKKTINKFLAVMLILTISNTVKSQDIIYGGFKGGPNYSVLKDNGKYLKSGIGYSFGYFEVLELTYKMNLQAEINYSNQTFINEVSSGTSSYKNTQHFRSIEIPLLVKYRPNDQFSIGLGYQFSLKPKSKGKEKTVFGTTTEESDYEENGINSNGLIFDASFKSGKTIVGLRVLSPTNTFASGIDIDRNEIESKSTNGSLYFAISLF